MILCIGTTPAAQRVMIFRKLEVDGVNRASTTLDGVAGKSINVAKVMAILGEQPFATGFAGGERGKALLASMAAKGIRTNFVMVPEPTRQCISVIDESERTVTELVEESRPVSTKEYESLQDIIHQQLPNCTAVVMSGSLTPGGPVNFYKNVTQQANQTGILSVVDAQGPPLIEALQAKPGLVKPNRRELGTTVQRALKTESDVIAAMRQVREKGAVRVVVTAGTEATLALSEEAIWRIQSPPVSAVNPIGSGDAFTAALVLRLVQADDLGEACRWAAAAGAANALNAMPGELDRSSVEKLVGGIKVERL